MPSRTDVARRGRRPKAPGIGPDLVKARAQGVPWKLLQRRYGLSRTQLWLRWAAALRCSHIDRQTQGA